MADHAVIVRTLRRATDHDRFACKIRYRDESGKRTDRFISPIHVRGTVVRALCLGRQEVRQFKIGNIEAIRLVNSASVLMPAPIVELPTHVVKPKVKD